MLTRARAAAWNVYAARVTAIVQKQHDEFVGGNAVGGLVITPPTTEHEQIIQKVIDLAVAEAQRDIIGLVLCPCYKMLDAIDNSRAKNESVKALRAELQRAYDELHTMQETLGKPPSADAVDPHAGN